MPYISEQGLKDKPLKFKQTVLIIIVLTILLTIAVVFQLRRDDKLDKSVKTKAVLLEIFPVHGAIVKYLYGERQVKARLMNGDYNSLSVGDTILIKYALEDPELVEVVDKYDMKKYKHLKND